MRSPPLRVAMLAGLALLLAPWARPARAADDPLVRLVIVSRHGVRSPIPRAKKLRSWSSSAWPAWPVGPGELTPRGRQLIALMGGYYGDLLRAARLLPATGCPAPASIYVWTDTDQRTKESGRGLLDGLAPGCGLTARTSALALDPLFRPLGTGACPLDSDLAAAAILGTVGDDLDAAVQAEQAALDDVQAITQCCGPALCHGAAPCNLAHVGTQLIHASDGSLRIEGALTIGSTAGEALLLEYAQGMPDAQVGWGRADEARISDALRLNALLFKLVMRTPYVARHGGTLLLRQVLAALTPAPAGGGGVAAPGGIPAAARFVAYVGHDVNLANVAAMLDASWQLPGYPPNYTVPGGALVFAERRAAGGVLKVYLSYMAQTLGQLRRMAPLSLAQPPARSPVFIPACSDAEPGYPCTLEAFTQAVRQVLVPECPVHAVSAAAAH